MSNKKGLKNNLEPRHGIGIVKKDRRALGNSKRVHLALIITFRNLRPKDKIQNYFSSNCAIGKIKVYICVQRVHGA